VLRENIMVVLGVGIGFFAGILLMHFLAEVRTGRCAGVAYFVRDMPGILSDNGNSGLERTVTNVSGVRASTENLQTPFDTNAGPWSEARISQTKSMNTRVLFGERRPEG
jgi:hypothetical protein